MNSFQNVDECFSFANIFLVIEISVSVKLFSCTKKNREQKYKTENTYAKRFESDGRRVNDMTSLHHVTPRQN